MENNSTFKDKLITVGIILLFLLLLPLILAGLLFYLLYYLLYLPFARPFQRRKYKQSHWYRDHGGKFNIYFYKSPAYTLYNALRELGEEFEAIPCSDIKGDVTDLVLVYRRTLLITEDFDRDFTMEDGQWVVRYIEYNDADEEIHHTMRWEEYAEAYWKERIPVGVAMPAYDRAVLFLRYDQLEQVEDAIADDPAYCIPYDPKKLPEALEKLNNL